MADQIKKLLEHRYGLTLFSFIAAAVVTGVGCVWFMWAFEAVLAKRALALIWTPVLFIASVELIRRFAPCADGAGIPQVVFAAAKLEPANEDKLRDLVSLRTMAVKIIALLLGVWAGASTGREGPTVHVATCLFVAVLLLARRLLGIKFDMRSAVIAGGAAGLAAAFNTPLAGVTFAIEELSVDYFGAIKDYVVLAIVLAAVAAQALTGDYRYFGHLSAAHAPKLLVTVVIGAAAGAAGAFFSWAISRGRRLVLSRQQGPWRHAPTAALALLLVAVARVSSADVTGPGNEAAQRLLDGAQGAWTLGFPLEKLAATLLTYWSGIAGGIFAPCLAVGAAMGANIGGWLSWPTAACALIGMAAFLSGTIQAPLTAFVIIFEMTGSHEMLLPVMLGSLVAFMTARLLGAKHLYHTLSQTYSWLLS